MIPETPTLSIELLSTNPPQSGGEVKITPDNAPALLLETVGSYLPPEDVATVDDAFAFMCDAHTGQWREVEKMPYWVHPARIAIAHALRRMPASIIIVDLLHDIVEDTGVTLDQIEQQFGAEIARRVDSVTKVPSRKQRTVPDRTLYKLFTIIAGDDEDIPADPAAFLTKIGDRVDNMSTVYLFSDKKKRENIAQGTLVDYVPFAEQFGLNDTAAQLGDAAVDILTPRQAERWRNTLPHIQETTEEIVVELTKSNWNGIDGLDRWSHIEIEPPSIWKLRRENTEFARVLVTISQRQTIEEVCSHLCNTYGSEEQCTVSEPPEYDPFEPAQVQFVRDGVAVTVVVMDTKQRIAHEASLFHLYQVPPEDRDTPMHELLVGFARQKLTRVQRTLRPMIAPDLSGDETRGVVLRIRRGEDMDLRTPEDDEIVLPHGATALDFAFQIHTEVGHRARSAVITRGGDTRELPLSQKLRAGDRVRIVTDEYAVMDPFRLDMAHTPYARRRIKKLFRSRGDLSGEVRHAVHERAFERIARHYDPNKEFDQMISEIDGASLEMQAKKHCYQDADALLTEIGLDDVDEQRVRRIASALHAMPRNARGRRVAKT